MTVEELDFFLREFDDMWTEHPEPEEVTMYMTHGHESKEARIVALVAPHTKPLQLSVRCDPLLAQTLREKYETILPARKLNPKYWNMILLTGQVPDEEVKDFIRLSYQLAAHEHDN